MIQEGVSLYRADALDFVQNRSEHPLSPQPSVVVDGKAMHFFLDGPHVLIKQGTLLQQDFLHLPFPLENQCAGTVAVVFGHARYWQIQPHGLHNFQSRAHMSLAAVNQQQIRENGKVLVPFQSPFEPAEQNLLHAAVIIGAFDGPDLESAIGLFVRLQSLEHHHGSNGIHAVRVGNVVGFHPVFPAAVAARFLPHANQDVVDLLSQLLGPLPFRLCPLIDGLDHFHHVFFCQLQHRPLLALLRRKKANLVAGHIGQVRFHQRLF